MKFSTTSTILLAGITMLATRSAGAEAIETVVAREVNIAPFAQVMTWDPTRTTDPPRRTEDFPAKDVFPGHEVISDDGVYTVPVYQDGTGYIGLEWVERRDVKKFVLEFADGSNIPAVENVRVEYWHEIAHFGAHEIAGSSSAGSKWHGEWKPLPVNRRKRGHQWMCDVHLQPPAEQKPEKVGANLKHVLPGLTKVRFVFPPTQKPVRLRRLSAFSRSLWQTTGLRIERDSSLPGKLGQIEIYNGQIIEPSGTDRLIKRTWDLEKPFELNVTYSKPQGWNMDRTILRFRLPGAAFGVLVEDVLQRGSVYVAHAGLLVTSADADLSLSDYRAQIKQKKTILERVREMPDQTLSAAMSVRPRDCDRSPTMLSLACNNRKFIVSRDGILCTSVEDYPARGATPPRNFLVPKFGSSENPDVSKSVSGRLPLLAKWRRTPNLSRRLHGDWLPILLGRALCEFMPI